MKVPPWRRYRDLLGANPERDLSDELRFHLETVTEELVTAGLSPDEAKRQALAQFGDVERTVAECRESDTRRLARRRRARVMDVLRQDIRYAVRSLLRRPGFALTVILILALGIGTNAAVFSVVDPLFLRPPSGVRAPDEIKQVYVERRRAEGGTHFQARFALPEARFIDSSIRRAFPSAIWFRSDANVVLRGGVSRPTHTAWITPNYFSLLGVAMHAGADFDAEDARLGIPASSAIISWALWQREFGGDPRALGATIRVGGRPVTIRGIAAERFRGIDLDAVDMWLPLGGYTGFRERPGSRWYDNWGMIAFRVIARVPRGETERFTALVRTGARDAAAFLRANPQVGARPATTVRAIAGSINGALGPDGMTRSETIAAMLGVLAFVLLLISAANVGNLLLGRALDREREFAVRRALGMSAARLLSQLGVESVLLALAATGAALVATAWTGGILRSLLLRGMELATPPVDLRVASVTLALGVGVGFAAGLVPLWASMRLDLSRALKSSARDGGRRRSVVRSALVGIQAALSMVLLVGTGLLGRSLYNVKAIELGLDIDRVITVTVADTGRRVTIQEVAALARSLPGVSKVALTMTRPLDTQLGAKTYISRAGDTLPALKSVGFVAAEPGYLAAVGTRIVRGRDLAADDRLGAAPVMVVSAEMARIAWPGQDPLGQCLRIERADGPCYMVVGVAANAHSFYVIEDPKPVFYLSLDQRPDQAEQPRTLVVRTTAGTAAITDRLRRAIGDTIPTARLRQVAVMADMVAWEYDSWELGAGLFAAFGGLALVLTALGLYGVLAYLVRMRTRELGIRLALGAERWRVMRLIIREGIWQILLGMVVGIVVALSMSGRLRALLFNVSPRDPVVVFVAVAVLVACAMAAALAPARRAMTIDPINAIRDE